jgi:uncharacterized membrane protein
MTMQYEKESARAMIGAFLAGAATALIAGGYLLYGPGGKQRRKQVGSWLEDARDDILSRMREMRKCSRDVYGDIVDEVLDTYALSKDLTDAQLRRIAARLKSRYREMKRIAEESAEEASIEADALEDED